MRTHYKYPVILLLALLTSCAGKKAVPTTVPADDEYTKQFLQAFNTEKDSFFASDSASALLNDLGWVKRLTTDAKISKDKLPSVFKNAFDSDIFSIELPCWEQSYNDGVITDDYVVSVVAEHPNLDSALIHAKIQGIDEIYKNNAIHTISHYDETNNIEVIDSIKILEKYEDYVRQAKFTCMFIMRTEKNYIVNAIVRVKDLRIWFDEKAFREAMEKRFKEYMQEHSQMDQQQDTIQTENAETPLESR